jgi:hypothetical protein
LDDFKGQRLSQVTTVANSGIQVFQGVQSSCVDTDTGMKMVAIDFTRATDKVGVILALLECAGEG